jgi:hypothetical protein
MLRLNPSRALGLAVLLTAIAIGLFVPALATAEVNPDMPFSVAPAPGNPSADKGYFVIDASPGQTVNELLRIRNDAAKSISVSLVSLDGGAGALGGLTFGLPGDQLKAIGTWVRLSEHKLRLAPHQTIDVPFTVTVPESAPAGDHVGGIGVWVPGAKEQKATDAGSGKASAILSVQTRRVLAVQVVVPGDAAPLLQITGVHPVPRPEGMYLGIDMQNTGRKIVTGGEGSIEMNDTGFREDISFATFIPDVGLSYPVKWVTDPEPGSYPAHVVVQYMGLTAEWSGDVEVTGDQVKELEKRYTGEPRTAGFALGTGLIAIIVACVLVLGGGLFWVGTALRRRPRER